MMLRLTGKEIAVIQGDKQISYAELRADAARVARNLLKLGIKQTQIVAVMLPTSTQYIALGGGIYLANLTPFPLNPYLPRDVIHEQLAQVNCRYLVTDKGSLADLPGITVIHPEQLVEPTVVSVESETDVPSEGNTIVFTSGSTGRSKAAALTTANFLSSARASNQNIPFEKGDRWLLSLPLYHVGGIGIVFRAMTGHGAMVIPDSAESLLHSLERFEITHCSVVQTQLAGVVDELRLTAKPLPKLKAVLVGGGPISADLIAQSIELGLPIFTSYGLTEMASQVTTTAPGERDEKLSTSGKLLRGAELKISSDGEILVRGEMLFKGYLGPDGLQRPFDEDGWFPTGDLGHLDRGGYLCVTGRKDNMFISGGENIHPEEIEAVIKAFPGVLDALVVPVKSVQWGERPVAFVHVSGGGSVDQSKLQNHISLHLPKFKCPDQIVPWPTDIPAGLKLSRPYFRELASKLLKQ